MSQPQTSHQVESYNGKMTPSSSGSNYNNVNNTNGAQAAVPAIPKPSTREQAQLLLLRWNALKSQGVKEETNQELAAITKVLRRLSSDNIEYKQKVHTLEKLREARSSIPNKADDRRLNTLRAQLQSFKLLSHNLDITAALQSQLMESLSVHHKSGSISNGQKVSFEESSPTEIKLEDFDSREHRAAIPPKGGFVGPQSVGGSCETIISNRITQRILELENLPAEMGTIDNSDVNLVNTDSFNAQNDKLKTKAVIELKSMRLLTKQKSLRQHIVYFLANKSDIISESISLRAMNRRVKIESAHVLRLTEQLEFQQRMDRERKERAKRIQRVLEICKHSEDVISQAQTQTARHIALGKSIMQSHGQIEREEQRRAERTAKQRLQALKSNDEEAYIKLLDQTKDTRITHLLRQTNTFLDSLAQAVKVQQQESIDMSPMRVHEDVSSETQGDDADERIDYYQVAHRVKEVVTKQPGILIGGTLKEYQMKGLQWMVSLYNNNLNGILADEMGLGKTIQSISLIAYLIETKRQPGPYLVIVPLSTLTNWTMEFEKWAPTIRKIVYKGPPNARKAQQGAIRLGDFQVLLTTYEYIIKDRPILSKIKWTHMIIDEGHRMKNTQSKLSYTLTTYYFSRHRLILTGTPLQNNLPELWALLNFVLPKIFNSVKTFDDWFNTPFANTGGQDKMELTEEETLLIIRRLHKVLRPFLLRRLKKDVEKDLPDKIEKVIKCKMSALQIKLYEQMLKHNVLFVGGNSGHSKSGIRGLNNKIMQLRKICNHPFVFEEVENLINPSRITNDNLWRVAGKFELLDRILYKFKVTGHRVLIFFQMTQVMDIMEDYLRFRGLQYLRLDGSTKADERSELLKLFNAPDSPYFAFLLSTRAGGLGLNLQTADTVIIYDTDWNPHQDLQAQDRAHRIGQTKEVRILRLITEDSVEEVILERAHAKLDIDGKVIQAGKFDNKSTAEEQEAFLRSLIESEEERRGQKEEDEELDEDELNEILARNEDEHVLFKQIDQEVARNSNYGKDKERPRLFSEEEMPEIYKEDIQVHLHPTKNEVLGRGARERKTVYYDDGLTEEQWLDAVDNDADTLEEAIERKRNRAEKRLQNKIVKQNHTDFADGEDLDGSEASSVVNGPSSIGKRKRGRRSTAESSIEPDSDPEDVDNLDEQSPAPVTRRLKLTTSAEPVSDPKMVLYREVLELTDDDGRNISQIFKTLPSKKAYPEYYEIIQKPISLDSIRKKITSGAFESVDDMVSDLRLMTDNAKTFNESGSEVYEDAVAIEDFVVQRLSELNSTNGASNAAENVPEEDEAESPPKPKGRRRKSGRNSLPAIKLTVKSRDN